MQTNLAGRLRNTLLPVTCGLLPLFEAVVNSIHGIEEGDVPLSDGTIKVSIRRMVDHPELGIPGAKKRRGPEAIEDIAGFDIEDNGIGFTDANMTSFRTLDTDHKVKKGCRGVGRLLWLKAFKKVKIVSRYKEGDCFRERGFDFDSSGVNKESQVNQPNPGTNSTVVRLLDFASNYRSHSKKTLQSISESILEHCLWYFVRPGGAPKITIWDEGESFLLDDLYDSRMHSGAASETIYIHAIPFDLIHVKLRTSSITTHAVSFCADNRLVLEETLAGKVPGLYGRLTDESGEFIYKCYVSSTFLDETSAPGKNGI